MPRKKAKAKSDCKNCMQKLAIFLLGLFVGLAVMASIVGGSQAGDTAENSGAFFFKSFSKNFERSLDRSNAPRTLELGQGFTNIDEGGGF